MATLTLLCPMVGALKCVLFTTVSVKIGPKWAPLFEAFRPSLPLFTCIGSKMDWNLVCFSSGGGGGVVWIFSLLSFSLSLSPSFFSLSLSHFLSLFFMGVNSANRRNSNLSLFSPYLSLLFHSLSLSLFVFSLLLSFSELSSVVFPPREREERETEKKRSRVHLPPVSDPQSRSRPLWESKMNNWI